MTRRGRAATILVADDDDDDRLLLQKASTLVGATADIRFVADGEELMDYLLRRGRFTEAAAAPVPSLVLLDLNMPRTDGRAALAMIKGDNELSSIPVVVFSTSRAQRDVRDAYALGANSFVVKPASFDDLVELLRRISQYWLGTVELPRGGGRRR